MNMGADGKPIIGDVGETAYEKIVKGQSGANFGWPNFEGDCWPNCGGVTPPLYVYPHSGAGAAVVGGDDYSGNAFPSAYQGKYFYGDYVQGYINYFDPSSASPTPSAFDTGLGSLSSINNGTDGCLYYLTIFPGELHRYCYTQSQQVLAKASSDKDFEIWKGQYNIPNNQKEGDYKATLLIKSLDGKVYKKSLTYSVIGE
jgi:hypothetical protein